MNIVSLTLRDCLGLSFQGIYIYLFIQYYFYYYLIAGVEIQKGLATTLAHI